MGLAKQSFELAPVAPITSTATAKPTNSSTSANRWKKIGDIDLVSCSLSNYDRAMDDVEDGGGDQEDEFLSEQQEVLKSPNK